MTSEVKNKYAYVITKDISNKFIDVNFCVAVMLMSLMNKISSLLFKGTSDFEQLFWTYAEFFLELIDVYEKFWLFLCNFQSPNWKSLTTNETENQKPL